MSSTKSRKKPPASKRAAGKVAARKVPGKPAPARASTARKPAKPAVAKKTSPKKASPRKASASSAAVQSAPSKSTPPPAPKALAKTAPVGATAAAAKAPRKARSRSAPKDLVHYYRLVFQVKPGASRKSEFYVFGTLEEIKKAALEDLESGDGAYHALFYGEEIYLQSWEGTSKVSTLDLHPYITYGLSDCKGLVTFKQKGDVPVFDVERHRDLMNALREKRVECEVAIDWDRMRLPPLRGRPLAKHELAPFDEGRPCKYGFHADWEMPITGA